MHQVDVTIARWLDLAPHEVLELERGEDIDRLTEFTPDTLQEALTSSGPLNDRLLEQVKHLEANITLRSPAVVRAIFDFAVHRMGNATTLQFLFTTTAEITRERHAVLRGVTEPDLHHLAHAGIHSNAKGLDLWELVRTRQLDHLAEPIVVGALCAALKLKAMDEDKPAHASNEQWLQFQTLLTEARRSEFVELVRGLHFSTGQAHGMVLRTQSERILVELGLAAESRAAQMYEHLFFKVFLVLCEAGPKHLTQSDLSQAVTTVRDSDRTFVEAFTIYLNTDTRNRLSDLMTLWREAQYVDVNREVQRLRQLDRWTWMTTNQKIEVLMIAWRLEHQLQRDAEHAKQLLSELDALSGDTSLLRAASAYDAADAMALAEAIQGRTDTQAIHARASIQLEHSQLQLEEGDLHYLIAQGQATAETYRLLALGSLKRGALSAARQKIDLALSMPTADEITRLSGAIITAVEARSPVLWVPALPQPVPAMRVFIRQDDHSLRSLNRAAELFGQAVQVRLAVGGRATQWQAWQLACLADIPARREEASRLAQCMLEGDPADPLPWLWVMHRELDVEVRTHLEVLENLIHTDASDNLLFAYVLALSVAGETVQAEVVQKRLPTSPPTPWITNNADALLVLGLPIGVRHPLAGAQAFVELAHDGEWTAVAAHARWFLDQVQTFDALVMASITTFNAAEFTTCRALLVAPDSLLLCPDGHLPALLQEQLAEAYARTGDLPQAANLAERILRDASDERRVTLYTQLLAGLGDDARLQVVAREAMTSPGLPPGLLLALIGEVLDHDPELARELWHRADELRYPDELLGWAISTASTLGLQEDAAHLLNRAWLAGSARTGIMMGTDTHPAGEQHQDGETGLLEVQLRQLVEKRQRAFEQANEAYHSASIPLAFAFAEQPIAALLAEILTNSGERLGLLGRHGARPLPADEGTVARLTLDLSGFVVAASFDLLNALHEEFGALRVTPYLMLALTQGMHACRPNPEEGVWQTIQDAVDNGHIHVLPEDIPRAPAFEHLSDGWEVATPYLAQVGGKVVDDLAVRLHGMGAPSNTDINIDTVLPKNVLTALADAGAVDEAQVEHAEPLLWSPHSASTFPVPGDTLFLTGTALHVLTRTGILQAANQLFTLVIAHQTAQANMTQLNQARRARQTREQLGGWRRLLRSGLHSRRFVVLPHPGKWTPSGPVASTADLEMILTSSFEPDDALWIEDRSFSAQPNVRGAYTWTLSDALATLQARGRLSEVRGRQLIRRQREVGMGLTPTSAEELSGLLRQAPFATPQPTPDLRAWALHLDAVRHFAPALQENEGPYVQQVIHASLQALLSLWNDPVSLNTEKKAIWLAEHAPLSVTNILQMKAGVHSPHVKANDAARVAQLMSYVNAGPSRTAFTTWWTDMYFTGKEEAVVDALCKLLLGHLRRIAPGLRREWLQLQLHSLPEVIQADVAMSLGFRSSA